MAVHALRRVAVISLGAALIPLSLVAVATTPATADKPETKHTTVEVYDSFQKPGGYTLADYNAKWGNPYGLGEMALSDTRSFAGSSFNVSATPYQTAFDFSVFDHLKYIAISNKSWPVPQNGSIEFSSTIRAATPGTQPGRVIHGTYVQSGDPYAEPTLEGQFGADYVAYRSAVPGWFPRARPVRVPPRTS